MKTIAPFLCGFLLLNSAAGAEVTAKFNFKNAAGLKVRSEEHQVISLNNKPLQDNTFKTESEFTGVTTRNNSHYVEVTYRSQIADLVINGQTLSTKSNAALKAASADLIGRKLTYVVGPDYRVKPEPDFFAEVKSLLGEAAVV